MTQDTTDLSSDNLSEDELLAYLVEHALELSELALKVGNPQASALLTLAASNLRTDAA